MTLASLCHSCLINTCDTVSFLTVLDTYVTHWMCTALVRAQCFCTLMCFCRLVKSHGAKGAAQVTFEALESKVPFMLKFLGSEDDDVSGTISPFAHDYMTLLKQMLPLDDKHRAIVQVSTGNLISSPCTHKNTHTHTDRERGKGKEK